MEAHFLRLLKAGTDDLGLGAHLKDHGEAKPVLRSPHHARWRALARVVEVRWTS